MHILLKSKLVRPCSNHSERTNNKHWRNSTLPTVRVRYLNRRRSRHPQWVQNIPKTTSAATNQFSKKRAGTFRHYTNRIYRHENHRPYNYPAKYHREIREFLTGHEVIYSDRLGEIPGVQHHNELTSRARHVILPPCWSEPHQNFMEMEEIQRQAMQKWSNHR